LEVEPVAVTLLAHEEVVVEQAVNCVNLPPVSVQYPIPFQLVEVVLQQVVASIIIEATLEPILVP
jgi:hypothetical protein